MIERPARSLSVWFLGLLLFLPLAGVLAAEGPALHILQLQHRPASEVMPSIEPLIRPGEVLTGAGFQLFLRSGPDTLAEVREVLRAVDRAAQNLVVSVRRGAAGATLGRGIGIEDPGDGPGVRWSHRRGTARDEGVQTVRILEGEQAFIRVGESIPHPALVVRALPRADVLAFGIDYQDLERGFVVRPWVEPNERIRLEIQYVDEREGRSGGGRIERQRVDTVLSGPVGEWISIRHGDERHQGTERRILGTRSLREQQDVQIQVRVDLAQ